MNLKTILVFSLIGLLFFIVYVLFKYVNARVGNLEDYVQKQLRAPAATLKNVRAPKRQAVVSPVEEEVQEELQENKQEEDPKQQEDEELSEACVEEYSEEEDYNEEELDDILSEDVKQIK